MGRGYSSAARRLGLRTVLVDAASRRDDYAGLVDEFVVCHDTSDEGWVRSALDAAEHFTPDAALAFSEPQVLAAAWVQDLYGLPGPSLRAAQATRNKALQRVLFDRSGVPQPAYCVVPDVDQGLAWARSRYPVILKPLRSSGSHGVQLVADERTLRDRLETRLSNGTTLLEDFIDAPEYSWEGLVRNGRTVFGNYTRKLTSGAPQFVELGHFMPHAFTTAQRDHVDGMIRRIVACLGIDTSLVHLEFRFDGTRANVMEVATRTPGDHLMDMLGLAYGHDLFEAVVLLALGQEPVLPRHDVRVAGIRFLTAAAKALFLPETIERMTEDARIVRVHLDRSNWERVTELENSADRLGHVLAAADCEDAVAAALRPLSAA